VVYIMYSFSVKNAIGVHFLLVLLCAE